MKVYGPYTRKDKRKHVIIIYEDGKRVTKSYPRYLVELDIGRELTKEETVDHIDNDLTNNDLSNLQILSLRDNVLKESKRKPRQVYKFICPICNKESFRYLNFVLNNIKQGKSGPFCSRSCAGKASACSSIG